MATFVVRSSHAVLLADGRQVAPGADVELTDDEVRHPANTWLVSEGQLVEQSQANESPSTTPQVNPPAENEEDE